MKANINGVVLIVSLLISLCDAVNIRTVRRDYYNSVISNEGEALFLSQKKSGVDNQMEAQETSSWFLIDDVFYWVYCRIYPTCYKRPRQTKEQKAEEEMIIVRKQREAELKKPTILNNTLNVTAPKEDWPNFYKGRSYIRDDTNKTEEEEEEDDAPDEPEVANGPTEFEKAQQQADEDAQRRYDKEHEKVSDTSKVATGHKQFENAKDEEDVTQKGERNKADNEDPIVELKDMPTSTIQKTRGKGKHVIRRRKKKSGSKHKQENKPPAVDSPKVHTAKLEAETKNSPADSNKATVPAPAETKKVTIAATSPSQAPAADSTKDAPAAVPASSPSLAVISAPVVAPSAASSPAVSTAAFIDSPNLDVPKQTIALAATQAPPILETPKIDPAVQQQQNGNNTILAQSKV